MSKLEYLKKAKWFLRKVLKERKKLNKKGIGYIPYEAKVDIPNIENAISRINNSDAMYKYLQRKETIIRFLIPSKWESYYNELKDLLHPQFN